MRVSKHEEFGLRLVTRLARAGGQLTIRELSDGLIDLWSNAPALDIELAAADAGDWTIIARNSLPDSLTKFTDRTVVDTQALTQQLRKIAENGYAIDMGEHIEDVRSVAVPVRDYTRAVVGTLAISGPAYRLTQERIDKEIVPLMVRAGQDLSGRLGFEGD